MSLNFVQNYSKESQKSTDYLNSRRYISSREENSYSFFLVFSIWIKFFEFNDNYFIFRLKRKQEKRNAKKKIKKAAAAAKEAAENQPAAAEAEPFLCVDLGEVNEFDDTRSMTPPPSPPKIDPVVEIDLSSVVEAVPPPVTEPLAPSALIPKRMRRTVKAPIMTIDLIEHDESRVQRRRQNLESPLARVPIDYRF